MLKKDNNSPSFDELVATLRLKLYPLFEKYNCQFAYLGGSWATGQANWWSDVDVFVSIPKINNIIETKTFEVLVALNTEAEQATGNSKLDIRVIDALPIHVQYQIIVNGILLYDKSEEVRLDYKERIMKLYYDHIIWYEKMLDLSLKQSK